MTKSDLIRSVFDAFELPRRQVTEIIDFVFAEIESTLITGDTVRLPLGVFRIRNRAARIARNPATGEPVKVPAKRVLKFLPSRAIKEAVAAKPGPKKKSLAKKAGAKKTSVKTAAKKTKARSR
jgi:nucleoid DNA-binding protein